MVAGRGKKGGERTRFVLFSAAERAEKPPEPALLTLHASIANETVSSVNAFESVSGDLGYGCTSKENQRDSYLPTASLSPDFIRSSTSSLI